MRTGSTQGRRLSLTLKVVALVAAALVTGGGVGWATHQRTALPPPSYSIPAVCRDALADAATAFREVHVVNPEWRRRPNSIVEQAEKYFLPIQGRYYRESRHCYATLDRILHPGLPGNLRG